jgi:hypothetical protein
MGVLAARPVRGFGAVAVARMFGRGTFAFAGSKTGAVELGIWPVPVTMEGALESPPPLQARSTSREAPRAAWFKRGFIASPHGWGWKGLGESLMTIGGPEGNCHIKGKAPEGAFS